MTTFTAQVLGSEHHSSKGFRVFRVKAVSRSREGKAKGKPVILLSQKAKTCSKMMVEQQNDSEGSEGANSGNR